MNEKGYYSYRGSEYLKLKKQGKTYYYKVEPIEWIVLERNHNQFKLIAKDILDGERFFENFNNRNIEGMTIYPNNYEHSTIRMFLNNYFYNQAFDDLLKDKILYSNVSSSMEIVDGEPNKYVSKNTVDKVYLPSYEKVKNVYFTIEPSRATKITDFAKRQNYGGGWWLRSPFYDNSSNVVNPIYWTK